MSEDYGAESLHCPHPAADEHASGPILWPVLIQPPVTICMRGLISSLEVKLATRARGFQALAAPLAFGLLVSPCIAIQHALTDVTEVSDWQNCSRRRAPEAKLSSCMHGYMREDKGGWPSGEPEAVLADPMCGSGTFLIEAALMATRTAPGLSRKDWPFLR